MLKKKVQIFLFGSQLKLIDIILCRDIEIPMVSLSLAYEDLKLYVKFRY